MIRLEALLCILVKNLKHCFIKNAFCLKMTCCFLYLKKTFPFSDANLISARAPARFIKLWVQYRFPVVLPLSTISWSVALCSTSKILPNHPSPTIWRTSNESIKCTWGNKEWRTGMKSSLFNIFLAYLLREGWRTFPKCEIELRSPSGTKHNACRANTHLL